MAFWNTCSVFRWGLIGEQWDVKNTMISIVYVRLRIQHPHGGSGFWALVICMTNFNLWCFLNPAESYIYDTFNFEGSCVNLRCSGQHARLYCTLAQTNPMHSFCAPRFLTYANNRPRTQQSHFRGDYRTLKTSTSVSDYIYKPTRCGTSAKRLLNFLHLRSICHVIQILRLQKKIVWISHAFHFNYKGPRIYIQ